MESETFKMQIKTDSKIVLTKAMNMLPLTNLTHFEVLGWPNWCITLATWMDPELSIKEKQVLHIGVCGQLIFIIGTVKLYKFVLSLLFSFPFLHEQLIPKGIKVGQSTLGFLAWGREQL